MANAKVFSVWGLLMVIAAIAAGETCLGPSVDAVSYTTPDTTVSRETVFVSEFQLKCKNGVKGLNLYTDIEGLTSPASYNAELDKYQVNYNAPHNKVGSGAYQVRIFDEEGFTALRKAQRSGEGMKNVKPLTTVTIHHPGVWKGPWVQTEFVALLAATAVFYAAYTLKSQLQS